MRKSRVKTVLFILSAAVVLMVGGVAYGIDPPHIGQPPFGVGCTSCHGAGFTAGATLNDTPINQMCRSCHKEGVYLVTGEHKIEPHSSITTGTNARPEDWVYDCTACHNPHNQRQPRMYRGPYSDAADAGTCLDERTILSIDQGDFGINNIITVSGTPWQPDQWIGFVVQPDLDLDLYYYIIDSDVSNLVVAPELDVSNFFGIWPGDTLGISYSKLVKDEIAPGYPVVNGSGVTLEGGFARPVKLFNSVGAYSRSETGWRATAVCLVCHTKTGANNYGIAKYGLRYVTQTDLDNYTAEMTAHNDGDTSCASCHLPHESGFKPPADCGVCHGGEGAMDDDSDVVKKIRISSSESPTGTGAWDTVKIGAHFTHRDKGGVKCYECHVGGMLPTQINSSTPDVGDYYIDIGFNLREGASGHANATDGTYSGRSGAQLDNGFIYNGPSFLFAPGAGDGLIECANVYCHSDGGNMSDTLTFQANPTWVNGPSAALACDQCHGNDGTNEMVITDSHRRHVDSPSDTEYKYYCKDCHNTTVDYGSIINSTNKTRHADGVKDVVFANLSPSGTYNDGANQCDNAYCHSNAAPVDVANVFNTPVWGDDFTGVRCRSCHSEQGLPSPNWSTAHSEHVNVYSGRFTCQACHDSVATGNTTLVASPDQHVDGIKNVVFNASYDISASYDSGLTRCSGVSCHSTGDRKGFGGEQYVNADWNAGQQGCALCHKMPDTKANMNTSTGLSNTHWGHVSNGTNEYGDPTRGSVAITCDMCHKDTTDDGLTIRAGSGITNHVNDVNDVDLHLDAINATASGTWSGSPQFRCDNTYCHGASLPYDSNTGGNPVGSKQNPQWADTSYYPGTIAGDCGTCHGFPPDDYAAGPDTHNSYLGATDTTSCVGCHTHLNGDGTFNDLSKHIDGISQAISCGGCHGIPPTSGTMVNEPGKGGTTGRESMGVPEGYHTLHADTGAGNLAYDCKVCHTGGQATSGQHNDAGTSEISMGFDVFGTQTGTYQAPAPTNGNYTVVANSPTVYVETATRLCSNIYCHSDGGNYAGTETYQGADWDDSDGLACSECHGTGAASGNRKDYVVTDAHPVHVDATAAGGYYFNCYLCHDLTVDEAPAVKAGAGFANHVDNDKDVVLATSGSDQVAQGGTWSRPQCTTTYCHSDGVNATGIQVPEWNVASTGDCGDCHGVNNATGPASGTHDVHVLSADGYEYSCVKCHTGEVTDTVDSSVVPDMVDNSIHVDGFVNAVINGTGPLGGGTYAYGTATCTTTYCHSDGVNATGVQVPDWDLANTGDCGDCHGVDNATAPASTTHDVHVLTSGGYEYACVKCHTGEVTDTLDSSVVPDLVNNSIHVDGFVNAVVNGTGPLGGGTYVYGTATCTTTYCHSDGVNATGVQVPDWDLANTGDCGDCHGASDASQPASASHDRHIGTAGYYYACEKCHTTIVAWTINSTSVPALVDNSLHVDGIANAILNASDPIIKAGASWDGTGCSSVYCHGAGMSSNGDGINDGDPNPAWANTSLINGNYDNDCSRCHGFPPKGYSGAHESMTNGDGSGCDSCHDYLYDAGDASESGWVANGTAFSNLPLHINGTVEGGGACNACHDTGPPTASLGDIHQLHYDTAAVPTGYGDTTLLSNTTSYVYACGKCHSTAGATHTNSGADPKVVEVSFDNTTDPKNNATYVANVTKYSELGTDGSTNFEYSRGTCSNLYCHGEFPGGDTTNNALFATSANGGVGGACGDCHGASAASVPSGGAHAEHVGNGAGQYSFTCDLCHESVSDATPSVIDKSIHVDGLTQWDLDVTNSRVGASAVYRTTETGSRVPDGTGGSCSNVKCHTSDGASGAPNVVADWSQTGQGCAYCHNSGSAMATNAHLEHVNQAGYLGDNFGCVDCHSGTVSGDTTISTIANHVDMDGTADVEGTYVGTYSAGSCTTSYCHSSGQETTTYENPGTWSAGALANDCKGCHGANGSSTSGEPDYANGGTGTNTANSHLSHGRASTADCNDCHDLTVNGSGNIFSGSAHLDGARDVNGTGIGGYNEGTETCSNVNCHSSDGSGGTPNDSTPQWGETWAGPACTYCHDSNAAANPYIMNTDAHTSHINNSAELGDNFGCVDCHSDTVSNDTTISAIANHLDLDGTPDVAGTYVGTYSAGACGTSYCHSTGQETTSYVSRNWTGGAIDCKGCHGAGGTSGEPAYANGGVGTNTANSHLVHDRATTTDCNKCHSGTVNGSGNLFSGGAHVDGARDVAGAGIGGYNEGTETCSNVNCHSSDGAGGTPNDSTPQWGETWAGPACTYCHNSNAAAAPTYDMETGAHFSHINNATELGDNFGCVDCHSDTVSNDTTISAIANHLDLDGTPDVAGTYVGTYSAGACNSSYCHSSGQETTVNRSVNWTGGALDCKGCHGADGGFASTSGEPNYANGGIGSNTANSHEKHDRASRADCNTCHNLTVNGSGNIISGGEHLNGAANASGPSMASYNASTETCTNVSCHGGNNVQWGDPNINCESCHGTTGTELEDFGTGTAASILNGSVTSTINTNEWTSTGHGRDAGSYGSTNPAANLLSGATDKCLACHDGGVAHGVEGNPFRLRNVATVNKVCMDCHDTDSATAPGVSGYREPTQAYVQTEHYNPGAFGTNQRHNATEFNGGRFCWDCHDPHGTPNNRFMIGLGPDERLTRRTTSGAPDGDLGIPYGGTSSVGNDRTFGRTATVTFATVVRGSEVPGDFITDNSAYDADKICETCHDGTTNGILHYGNNLTGDSHNSTLNCVSCHQHTNGFKGEGEGGACAACHGAQIGEDIFDRMSDTSQNYDAGDGQGLRASSYKHLMVGDDPTENVLTRKVDVFTGAGDTNRTCTACHADHDAWKPGAGGPGRAYNLRVGIDVAVDEVAHTGITNTDFIPNNSSPGICLSCHAYRQTKGIKGPNAATTVAAIPYPASLAQKDQAPANLADIVNASVHAYPTAGQSYADGSAFGAVCLKCHNDTLEKSKSVYGQHGSSKDRFLAVMGEESVKCFLKGTVSATGTYNTVTAPEITQNGFAGMYAVVTDASGTAYRAKIIATNTGTNTFAVEDPSDPGNTAKGFPGGYAPQIGDELEVTKKVSSIDDLCFNCHSKASEGMKNGINSDFYNTVFMSDDSEAIRSLFNDASGEQTVAKNAQKSDEIVDTVNSPFLSSHEGFFIQFTGGLNAGLKRQILTYTDASNVLLASTFPNALSIGDAFRVVKPAVHPIDKFGKHNYNEFYDATAGWNKGEYSNPADPRHTSCADCHNTHAAPKNPKGNVNGISFPANNTLRDTNMTLKKTAWQNDKWVGFVIWVTAKDGTNPGMRQLRQITSSTTTTTHSDYVVGIDFDFSANGFQGATQFVYEAIMLDGGTGSGGNGVSGLELSNHQTVTIGGSGTGGENLPANPTYTKKFDAGMGKGFQYEQCLRCHSAFAWGLSGATSADIPDSPSGFADGSAVDETDVALEINPNNLAHHAIVATGKNQPILPSGQTPRTDANRAGTTNVNVINQYWPVATATADITSCDVTLTSGTLPRTALPGWYVYIGANGDGTANNWYQITTINSATSFTIAKTSGATPATGANPDWANPYNPTASCDLTDKTGQAIQITAGLGNTFIPPFGPWTKLKCTDCHGSTLSDPIGPHASVNKWLLKSVEPDIKFEWYNGSTVAMVNPQNSGAQTANFCYNCHRRDVYGGRSATAGATPDVSGTSAPFSGGLQTRIPHNVHMDGNNSTYPPVGTNYNAWPQYCRMCHAGSDIGTIHGTNWTNKITENFGSDALLTRAQGKRFLNGASWAAVDSDSKAGFGLKRSTTTTAGGCYTNRASSNIVSCGKGHDNEVYDTTATYDYDNP